MIVDDNPRIRETIKSILQDDADAFCECSDGDEVLETYSLCKPDWVLMDVVMKRMDGLTATEQLMRKYPKAKVIIVTQHNDPKMKERAIELGVAGYVLKERLWEMKNVLNRN